MKNRLVAHRGDMTSYPENSLLSIQAAVDLGLSFIEVDVQLSKDAVPIVIHDDNLQRTAGINKKVCDLNEEQITACLLHSLSELQQARENLYVPTLKAVIELLNSNPDLTLFVEIKRQSIEYFALNVVLDAVIHELKAAKFNVVIISFVADVISYVRELKEDYPLGWVLREFDQAHRQQALAMQPDYLFCNINKVDHLLNLWQGPWQWVLYDIKDPQLAEKLLKQGVSFVETGDIVKLTSAKEFQ